MGRDAVALHHEAGFLAAVDLVGIDQALAEFRLEHVGQHDDRCVDFESGEQAGLRQVAQECEHRVVAGVEGKYRAHAQRRVDHHPEAPVSHLRRERLVLGNRPIGPRNRAVEIPEMPDARNAFRDTLLAFVRGIEAHPEQRYAAIVEQGPVGFKRGDRAATGVVRRGAVKAQHDETTGREAEVVLRSNAP
jgi:hypothetical protein